MVEFSSATQTATRALRAVLNGKVVSPNDESYARARRVWNEAVDLYPAAIAHCESAQDVQSVMSLARQHNVAISVRGAGYDVLGRSVRPGGWVIDLSRMKQIRLTGSVATVAGGATASAVVEAATLSGFTAVGGWNGVVGMAGLTLTGGYGPLIASHGLACDSLVSTEVVLADGRCVTADAEHNPDLLWALRGGGGNFGVVTSMQLRLHPLRQIRGGMILFGWSDAASVLGGYAEIAAAAGDDMTIVAGMFCTPDGQPTLFLAPAWTGDVEDGSRAMEKFGRLGKPLFTELGTMSYPELLRSFDSRVANDRHYAVQTRWIPKLTSGAVAEIVRAGSNLSSPLSTIILQHFRGAATRVPLGASAFGVRREHFLVEVIASWARGPGEQHRAWAQSLSHSLAGVALPGGYPAMLGYEDRDQIALAYGENLAKLRRVKRQYDPEGFFSATPLGA